MSEASGDSARDRTISPAQIAHASVRGRYGVYAFVAIHCLTTATLLLLLTSNVLLLSEYAFGGLYLLIATQAWLLAVWAATGSSPAIVRAVGFLLGMALLAAVLPCAWEIGAVRSITSIELLFRLAPALGGAMGLLFLLIARQSGLRFVCVASESKPGGRVQFPFRIRALLCLTLAVLGFVLLLSLFPARNYLLSMTLAWTLLNLVVPAAAFTAAVTPGKLVVRILAVPFAVFASLALVVLLWPRLGYGCMLVPYVPPHLAYLYGLYLGTQAAVMLSSVWIVQRCGYRLVSAAENGDARRMRFSIRDALLVLLIVATACGAFKVKLDQADLQRRAVAAINQQGGEATYDEAQPPFGAWFLTSWLPDDFLAAVVGVEFERCDGDLDLAPLRDLPHATWLSLRDCPVEDRDLRQLAHHPRLTQLTLIRTPISDQGLRHVETLPILEGLTVWETHVTSGGVTRLRTMQSLRWMRIDGECVSPASVAALNEMPALGQLGVRGNHLDDDKLRLLKDLRHVKWLGLRQSKVTDRGLTHLAGMRQLEHLILDTTPVTNAGLEWLRRARPDLDVYPDVVADAPEERDAVVDLYRCSADLAVDDEGHVIAVSRHYFTVIDDEGCRRLSDLKRLTSVNVRDSNLSDAALAHFQGLKSLETIYLDNTNVTDAGLAHLGKLPRLNYVSLSGTKVTRAGVKKLKQAQPTCVVAWP